MTMPYPMEIGERAVCFVETGGDVSLQDLSDGLVERGLKIDYRTMWKFAHLEGNGLKKPYEKSSRTASLS
jgi:hypothetical protein